MVKPRQNAENVAVNLDNLLHGAVFPQFVPVPEFDARIAVPVIIFQRRFIQMLVFEKIIVGTAGSAMTVADQKIA